MIRPSLCPSGTDCRRGRLRDGADVWRGPCSRTSSSSTCTSGRARPPAIASHVDFVRGAAVRSRFADLGDQRRDACCRALPPRRRVLARGWKIDSRSTSPARRRARPSPRRWRQEEGDALQHLLSQRSATADLVHRPGARGKVRRRFLRTACETLLPQCGRPLLIVPARRPLARGRSRRWFAGRRRRTPPASGSAAMPLLDQRATCGRRRRRGGWLRHGRVRSMRRRSARLVRRRCRVNSTCRSKRHNARRRRCYALLSPDRQCRRFPHLGRLRPCWRSCPRSARSAASSTMIGRRVPLSTPARAEHLGQQLAPAREAGGKRRRAA